MGQCECTNTYDTQCDFRCDCEYWKGLGYCETNSWVRDNCIATCSACDVNGGWSKANMCINGERILVCNNPVPIGNGAYCTGDATQSCDTKPVNCEWDAWGSWGSCSGGTKQRSRSVKQQAAGGGNACQGSATEEQECVEPVNCAWNDWGSWGSCSASYDGGTQQRQRDVKQQAANGGNACQGSSSEERSCNEESCSGGGGGGSTEVCKATNGKTCLTRSQVEEIAGNLFDDFYGNSQATCFTSYGGHCLTKLKKKKNGSIKYQYGNCNPSDPGCN